MQYSIACRKPVVSTLRSRYIARHPNANNAILGDQHGSVAQEIENPCVGGSIPPLATNVFCAKRKITADSIFANGENQERHPPSDTTCVNELPRFHRIAATGYAPRSEHH